MAIYGTMISENKLMILEQNILEYQNYFDSIFSNESMLFENIENGNILKKIINKVKEYWNKFKIWFKEKIKMIMIKIKEKYQKSKNLFRKIGNKKDIKYSISFKRIDKHDFDELINYCEYTLSDSNKAMDYLDKFLNNPDLLDDKNYARDNRPMYSFMGTNDHTVNSIKNLISEDKIVINKITTTYLNIKLEFDKINEEFDSMENKLHSYISKIEDIITKGDKIIKSIELLLNKSENNTYNNEIKWNISYLNKIISMLKNNLINIIDDSFKIIVKTNDYNINQILILNKYMDEDIKDNENLKYKNRKFEEKR